MKKPFGSPLNSSFHPVVFYVAPDGHDTASGRSPRRRGRSGDGPLATLEGARDAVRAFRRRQDLPAGGIRVEVLPGVYERTQTLELGPEDSGAGYAPIVYAGSSPERVVLRGGSAVTEWRPVTDPAVLARLDPAARGRVQEADLKALGLTDWGALTSRGFGRPTTPAALELFYQGRPMPLARWPNVDYVEITGLPAAANKPDGWGGVIAEVEQGFLFASDRLRRWRWPQEVWVHGYWVWDWANTYEKVQSLDPETGHIQVVPTGSGYGFRQGQRFFFQNILEELDSPGEWYLDRERGRLYFWPPGPMKPGSVVVSRMETPMIAVKGASDIRIEGMTLEACRAQAVALADGARVEVRRCRLRDIGTYAVTVEGGESHRVAGCEIAETGDGGVKLKGGDRRRLIPCRHEVIDCHIHHFSRWSKCYCPGILADGVGMTFRHNRLHSAPHTAILFTGNEFRIENNEIYQVCLETGDAGAIYTGRDYSFRGNLVCRNFIHHMGGVGMGTMGIYNDDCVSGTKMIGNIFYRATRAVMIGGGRDMLVENNLFVDCEPAISFDSRGVSPHPIWQKMVNEFMKQRLDEMQYREEPYRSRYPEVLALTPHLEAGKGVPPERVFARRNICIGGTWLAGDAVAAQHLNAELNVIRTDRRPGLGLERLAFRLPAAWLKAAEFEPLRMAEIGLQKSAERRTVPPRELMTAGLELIRPPVRSESGSAVDGQVRLTLENPGQTPQRGEIRLHVEPAEGIRWKGGRPMAVPFRLAPGGTATRDLSFSLADGVEAVRLSWSFPGDTCFRQTLDLRVVCAWPIRSLRRPPSTAEETDRLLAEGGRDFQMEGQSTGRMVLAMTPRGLWLGAEIRDAAPEPGDPVWEKSCLELFVAPAGQTMIRQVLFSPPGADRPARALEALAEGCRPCAGVRMEYAMRAEGYRVTAWIPLERLGLEPGARSFHVESQLTTRVANPPVYRHLRLFGNRRPRDLFGYARAEVGGNGT